MAQDIFSDISLHIENDLVESVSEEIAKEKYGLSTPVFLNWWVTKPFQVGREVCGQRNNINNIERNSKYFSDARLLF